MLEPSQHVLIPATAEGLCKIYDSKPWSMLFIPLLLSWIQVLKKKSITLRNHLFLWWSICLAFEWNIWWRKREDAVTWTVSWKRSLFKKEGFLISTPVVGSGEGWGESQGVFLWKAGTWAVSKGPFLLFTQIIVLVPESQWFPFQFITSKLHSKQVNVWWFVLPFSFSSLQPLFYPYSFNWKH